MMKKAVSLSEFCWVGLPDDIVPYQKTFLCIFWGPWNQNVGIFYGHFGYIIATWYI
jgi:hypothetical protein